MTHRLSLATLILDLSTPLLLSSLPLLLPFVHLHLSTHRLPPCPLTTSPPPCPLTASPPLSIHHLPPCPLTASPPVHSPPPLPCPLTTSPPLSTYRFPPCPLTASPPLPCPLTASPSLSLLHPDHTHASIAWTCLHIRHLTNFWRNSQLQWKKEGHLASSSGTGAATGLNIIVHNAPYSQYLQAPPVACILCYL